MRTVWWKCSLGHSWKAKVSERAIEGKGCKVCEKDYLTVFPKLAVMYYAAMKHIKVQTDIDMSNENWSAEQVRGYMADMLPKLNHWKTQEKIK